MRIRQKVLDWLIGLAVTLFFLLTTSTGPFDFMAGIGLTDGIEMKAFDFTSRIAAPGDRNPDIELVVITDDDLSELGRFPWPRDILAQGIQNLALAGAKVIALNIQFTEPEESAGLRAVERLKESYEISGLARQGAGLAFYKKLSKALADLDNDTKFYKALEKAGNVVLPVCFDTLGTGRDLQAPNFIAKHAFKRVEGVDQESAGSSLIRLSKLKPILPSFAEAAAGIGHINPFPNRDGYLRDQVHVVGYLTDICFPSFPMAIVKLFKGLKDEDISVVLDEGVNLRVSPSSVIKVPVVNSQMRTLIKWNQGPDVAFHQTPFTKVFNNQIQTSLFRDKIVIIGATAPGLGDRFVTPISGNLAEVEVVANSVADILNQSSFSRPQWISLLEFSALVFFGLFITFVLPGLKAGTGAVTTLGLLVVYGIIGTILFLSSNIWLRIVPPLLLLIFGYVLVVSKRFLIADRTETEVEAGLVKTGETPGLPSGEQGMPDAEQIPGLEHAEAAMNFESPEEGRPGHIGATLEGMDTRPTLGRYEVIGEIGRGAMGVVYKGRDPKIHRIVAIKTVRLSEFDEDIVDEMKDRFFREAESAGLLNHPNIVAIYDCGEEDNLAYIAMEYLEGEDLEQYTKPNHLLPIRDTLDIIARVADGLGYAHRKNVVHRDIKPANIMRIKGTDEVKLADFGIARVTSASKTKTGIVLGTPSYMSPEQVSGKKVDGRSDIFSVGVVLFEMLTGQKPFEGEDVTSLMFKIAKERHPSPRDINPRTPRVVEKVIDKALEKDLEKRYQRAGQMAAHLKQVVARIDELVAQKRSEPNSNSELGSRKSQ